MPLLVVWDFNGVLNTLGSEVEPLLRQLQSAGADQIIVSSSMVGSIEHYLKENGLDTYFSQVYGFAPTSLTWVGDSEGMKTQSMQRHIRKFGPFESIVTIGDSDSDMRAGQAASATTIHYGPGHSTVAMQQASNLDELVQILSPNKK